MGAGMTPTEWIGSVFSRWGIAGTEAAAHEMLGLQFDNLEVRFRTIDKSALTSDSDKKIYDEISAVFDLVRPRSGADSDLSRVGEGWTNLALTWDDAYRLETQIALLLSDDRLRQEVAARLRVAAQEQVREAGSLQSEYVTLNKFIEEKKPTVVDSVLRDFLLQVLEAIHWHSKRKYLARKVRVQAARNTLTIALMVLGLVLWPYLLPPEFLSANVSTKVLRLTSLEAAGVPADGVYSGGGLWAHFGLYTALTCGVLGALFSRLITLQTNWSVMALDELYNARAIHYILLRASIGMCGALIIYFFLQSGLVKGNVFPDFQKLTLEMKSFGSDGVFRTSTRLVLPSADLALLIVWSFIAGFSESLVPSVLTNTERQLGGELSTRPL
jgi:hypothetical protein